MRMSTFKMQFECTIDYEINFGRCQIYYDSDERFGGLQFLLDYFGLMFLLQIFAELCRWGTTDWRGNPYRETTCQAVHLPRELLQGEALPFRHLRGVSDNRRFYYAFSGFKL